MSGKVKCKLHCLTICSSPLLMFAISLILIIPSSVNALLASPAKYDFAYADAPVSYSLTVHNDESQTLRLTITPVGPLASAISVTSSVVIAPQESKTIPVRIAPSEPDAPGILESGLLIEAEPLSSGTVGAQSALLHVIRMRTPQEGTYVSGSLLHSTPILGEPVAVTITLQSVGTEKADLVQSTLHVSGAEEFTQNFETISLEPGEQKNLAYVLRPNVAGTYTLDAEVKYANKTLHLTTMMPVGNLSASVLGAEYGEFRLGDPFKVSAVVRSDYADSLPISVEVGVEQRNMSRALGRSTSVLFQPLETRAVPVYLESAGLEPGPAVVVVTANFGAESYVFTQPVVVGVDYFGNTPPPSFSPLTGIIMLVGLILVGGGIGLWFYARRKQ